MKKSLDRGFEPEMDDRDRSIAEALTIEALEPRRRKHRNVVLGLALVVVAGIVGAGFVSRAAGLGGESTPTLAAPTPITWSAETVDFTPAPAASDDPAGAAAPLGPTPHPRTAINVSVSLPISHWEKSHGNEFTVSISNRTGLEIPLDPCPAYRMYIAGTDVTAAPLRLLNCAALGRVLSMGQTVTMQMVYQPSADDPVGPQVVVWTWISPDDYQATQTAKIFLSE